MSQYRLKAFLMRYACFICFFLIYTHVACAASIKGVHLLCKPVKNDRGEVYNPETISINYELGTAVYLSPNKRLSNIYPGTSLDSFQAYKDVSAIAVTPNLTILETTSYDKQGQVSWYRKRIIEINKSDSGKDASMTEFYGSKLNQLTKQLSHCSVSE